MKFKVTPSESVQLEWDGPGRDQEIVDLRRACNGKTDLVPKQIELLTHEINNLHSFGVDPDTARIATRLKNKLIKFTTT